MIAARYLTADIPGIGGTIRQRPEDFLVEEMPLYQPKGEGEHAYLFVQKREMSTSELLGVIAHHFGVNRRSVGYAGQKDKHAVTRQLVSVHIPGKHVEDFPMLQHERATVLWADQHVNKLRVGHLLGNRFSVRIRDVKPTDVLTAQRVLKRLETLGVPNRFGPQRFGAVARNHLVGKAILLGDWQGAVKALLEPSSHSEAHREARRAFAEGRLTDSIILFGPGIERRVLAALLRGESAERAIRGLESAELRFFLNAFQSAVFNVVVDERITSGTLGTLHPGDIAIKHVNDAPFTVDLATAQLPDTLERLRKFEISPSGPMWGGGMLRADGEAYAREIAALGGLGVNEQHLSTFDQGALGGMHGERRSLRIRISDIEIEGGVDEHGSFVRCAFDLPRGSFATTVLAEIMKTTIKDEERE
ncbi:MAG: tRNA pseudouridine(13) synthase TruD [Planctomycetes bacterium]|nr:tRNA pseudouridine(13) synthase TruD [Planctomycetota bacterium]